MLARDQLAEITTLLLVAAVAADLVDAEVGMRAVGQPDRSGSARDLLHGDAVLEIAEPRPAPFFLHRDAVHAELTELGPQITREGIAAVDLVGARRDAVVGEVAHAGAQHVGGLAQTEIEAANVVHPHRRQSRMGRSGSSVPIPKSQSLFSTLICELRNRRTLATY